MYSELLTESRINNQTCFMLAFNDDVMYPTTKNKIKHSVHCLHNLWYQITEIKNAHKKGFAFWYHSSTHKAISVFMMMAWLLV